MMRHTGVLLAALLVLGVLSCQSKSNGVTEKERVSSKRPAEGILLQKDSGGALEGEGCHQDAECMQPLRCLSFNCAVPPAVKGRAEESTARLSFLRGGHERGVLLVELADTEFERQRGLMFRTQMAPEWGMLFVFPRERPRHFWMANTFLPLDMVFIDGGGEVRCVVEHAMPLEEGPRYGCEIPTRFVLEVNEGVVSELGIAEGDQVALHGVEGVRLEQ